jgi:hypothetical protein
MRALTRAPTPACPSAGGSTEPRAELCSITGDELGPGGATAEAGL